MRNLNGLCKQMENFLILKKKRLFMPQAKAGIGITDVLDAVIERIPAPARRSQSTISKHFFLIHGLMNIAALFV